MDMDMELDSSTSEQVSRLQLLYLFPRHHEFHRDEVIQLWMAHDLVPLLPPQAMDFQLWIVTRESGLVPPSAGIARFYFEKFEELGVFQISTLDYSVGQQRYKLSNSFVDLLAQNRSDEFFRVDDLNSHVSENTMHASFRDDDIDPLTLNELYKAERLLTLLILHRLGSHLAQIPRDLFLKLPLLRVLDLSYSSLTELPSSIGNLKDLRYLNLSYTPITALPKSLCSLYQMQTLKLRGCLKLLGLPKGMRKLVNLVYLEVDLDCLMVSMPPGLGDLAELQTLPAFVVGREDGCHITELKNMIDLCGTLSILRLENVSSSEEAKISALDNKEYLQNVELHWTDCVDGFQVLESLQPHPRIKELQIVGYGGAEFPNWIGEPIFFNLATITISDCRNSELFPPIGNLPSLQYLSISDMHAVKQINSTFCGRNMDASLPGFTTVPPKHFSPDDTFRAFQSLEKLTLNGMPMLETWNGIEAGDFPRLQKFSISQCPRLTSLPELSLLVSLQHLEISLCPLLESFPSKGLPTSLQCLVIIDCPLLEVLSHKDDQKYWEKLAHISSIWIDYERIIQNQCMQEAEAKIQIPVPVQPPVDFECQREMLKPLTTLSSAIDSNTTFEDYTSMTEDSCFSLEQFVRGTSFAPAATVRPSGDLYNWRKYGQKKGNYRQKKGKSFDYQWSYYKCTHEYCQAEKRMKRYYNGVVIERIYDGTHNHPMPQSSRQAAIGSAFILSEMPESVNDTGSSVKFEGGSTGRSTPQGSGDDNAKPDCRGDHQVRTSSSSCVTAVEEENSVTLGSISLGDDQSKSKRRKKDSAPVEAHFGGYTQIESEMDIIDDGCRWSKFREVAIQGNPNPRSYYKCMNVGCSVKKQVVRALYDPKRLIVTYYGKHKHEMPAARSSNPSNSADEGVPPASLNTQASAGGSVLSARSSNPSNSTGTSSSQEQ